jgi:hypothetical protein
MRAKPKCLEAWDRVELRDQQGMVIGVCYEPRHVRPAEGNRDAPVDPAPQDQETLTPLLAASITSWTLSQP